MPSATTTCKGHITDPKQIRDYLHAAEADQIEFAITPHGEAVVHRLSGSIADLAGLFRDPGRATVTLAEMDAAIAAGASTAAAIPKSSGRDF